MHPAGEHPSLGKLKSCGSKIEVTVENPLVVMSPTAVFPIVSQNTAIQVKLVVQSMQLKSPPPVYATSHVLPPSKVEITMPENP
jgi:hypothetical protein